MDGRWEAEQWLSVFKFLKCVLWNEVIYKILVVHDGTVKCQHPGGSTVEDFGQQFVQIFRYSHGPSFLRTIPQALQAFATVSCGMFP